mmetsp:Transcript_11094/g.26012  ORF Transcript_11094/g.26012 Transcript_11094/m.26012 type:complete len:262 (+) Transcript_11094:493-1278(+)
MHITPPCLKVCLRRSGSMVGSSSSSTFSSSTGVPNWMEFSRVRTKSASVSLMIFILFFFSMFRKYLFAWPWGSIHSGQRRAVDTTMPLSTEKESAGRPLMIHSRILTGSPSTDSSENACERGTSFSPRTSIQWLVTESRYPFMNAPRYATYPDETSTSPVRLVNDTPSLSATSVHRNFSPPRPWMSCSARSSFTSHSATWAVRSRDLFSQSNSWALSESRSSTTIFSAACFCARTAIAPPNSSSAALSAACLGATTLATRS